MATIKLPKFIREFFKAPYLDEQLVAEFVSKCKFREDPYINQLIIRCVVVRRYKNLEELKSFCASCSPEETWRAEIEKIYAEMVKNINND